jgi:hypothetical protein
LCSNKLNGGDKMAWFTGDKLNVTGTDLINQVINDSVVGDMYLNTVSAPGNIYKQVVQDYWLFLYNANTNSNPINIELLSEDAFNSQTEHDNSTLSVVNSDGEFTDETQSATLFIGPNRLSDIVILNDIPGIGTTYQLYIENNVLKGLSGVVSNALGNPQKLYLWFNNNNYSIFVYNPKLTQYMQLGNNVNSGGSTGSSVYFVQDPSDISNPNAYIDKTLVYYEQQ